jgi:hypothetical protein
MGLPARQRRMLGRIESALRGSDPRLAALYTIFARLNRDEDMPRIEQLRHGVAKALARTRLRLAHAGAIVVRPLIPRRRAALLLPVALGLTVASIVVAAIWGSGPTCAPVTPLAASSTHSHSSKLCKPQPMVGMYLGH